LKSTEMLGREPLYKRTWKHVWNFTSYSYVE